MAAGHQFVMTEITDVHGRPWTVYEVASRDQLEIRPGFLPEGFRAGWLVFLAAGEKRRIAPVPQGWETLAEERLLDLLADATPARPDIRLHE